MESLLKEMVETNIRAAKNTLTECDAMDQKFMAWKIGEDDTQHQLFIVPMAKGMEFSDERTQAMLAIVLKVAEADGYAFASDAWTGMGATKGAALAEMNNKRECLIIDCVERDLVDENKPPNRVMTIVDYVRYGEEIVYGDSREVNGREATGKIGNKTLFELKLPNVPAGLEESIRKQLKHTRL